MTDDTEIDVNVEDSNFEDSTESPSAKNLDPDYQDGKLIPASRVTELVKKAKLKGRQSMAEQLQALESEIETLRNQNQGDQASQPPSMPLASPEQAQLQNLNEQQNNGIDYDSISQQVMERLRAQRDQELQQQQQQELERQAQEIASTFNSRMSEAAERYDDFAELTQDFNPAAFPNLVALASQFDNTGDIMRDLLKNPNKLSTAVLLSERDPHAAMSHLKRLSGSLQANAEAKAMENATPEPLGRLQSSPVNGQASGDVNSMSMRDFKQMFKRR